MSSDSSESESMLSPVALYILVALAEGERHGYAIIKDVETATNGRIKMLPGTLYRLIKQMVIDRWIVEVDADGEGDSRRRYYRLTPRGRRVAANEVTRLAEVVRMAQSRKLVPVTLFA